MAFILKRKIKARIENETGYVHRLAEATTHLHSDKVKAKQERNRKIQDQEEHSGKETENDRDLETTDSKFKTAY